MICPSFGDQQKAPLLACTHSCLLEWCFIMAGGIQCRNRLFLNGNSPTPSTGCCHSCVNSLRTIKMLAVHTRSLKLGLCFSGKIFFTGQKITTWRSCCYCKVVLWVFNFYCLGLDVMLRAGEIYLDWGLWWFRVPVSEPSVAVTPKMLPALVWNTADLIVGAVTGFCSRCWSSDLLSSSGLACGPCPAEESRTLLAFKLLLTETSGYMG